MLLEWGVVKKNNTSLHAINIQSYLIRGAIRKTGRVYPNQKWGYGIVNIEGVFDSIKQIKKLKGERYIEIVDTNYYRTRIKEYYNNIFIRNPYL